MEIPLGTQPTIHSNTRIRFDDGVLQGGSAFVGTAGGLLPSRLVPSQSKNVESSSGYSHTSPERYNIPTSQSIQTSVPARREPSASKTLLVPHANRASTTDRGVLRNATRSSSTAYHSPAFLPTPPPEPHPSLPQFAIPEFDSLEFQRSEVYPYGVETPGLVHSREDDYFGK